MGLNLVPDYLHYNMHRQFLLFAGMRGKHVCHFCIITAFSTQHVVSKRLVLNFGKSEHSAIHLTMTDSEDEVFLTQNSFAGSLQCGDNVSALLQEDVPHLEADGSYLDVEEAVSNLFCFNNNSSSSALPLPFESQGSCGDLEGTVEAEVPVPTVKKGIKPAVKRGIEAVTDEELAERNRDRIPPNTKKGTSLAVRVWNEWSEERNSLPISSRQEAFEFVVAPVAEILHTVCDYELCFWLSKFVHEICKQDGTYYPPNTLYQICVGVQRYLRENGFEG